MAATPHVRDDFPTTADQMEAGVAKLNFELLAKSISLVVEPGAEVAIERLRYLGVAEMRRLTLGGTGVYMLVETPYTVFPARLPLLVQGLRDRGITPVMAHPERCRDVQRSPDIIRLAVERGALVQVTAGSVVGDLGEGPLQAARHLLRRSLVHLIGSDTHGVEGRASLARARREAENPDDFDWMTKAAGRAVLAGRPLPPRPPVHRRNWRGGFGR